MACTTLNIDYRWAERPLGSEDSQIPLQSHTDSEHIYFSGLDRCLSFITLLCELEFAMTYAARELS